MARALIVGCGCRGRELGARLAAQGWLVRGTTRDPARAEAIEAAGIEAAIADPAAVGTVLDHVPGVAVVLWLMGSAAGTPEDVAALHGPRLERLMEELIDTPVRGVVYEGAGSVPAADLERGAAVVRGAAERHRIPAEVVDRDPADASEWTASMAAAVNALVGL
jgi:nucleoside-diphosphate-sugar epimerase